MLMLNELDKSQALAERLAVFAKLACFTQYFDLRVRAKITSAVVRISRYSARHQCSTDANTCLTRGRSLTARSFTYASVIVL